TLSNASRKRACVSRDAIVLCLLEGRLARTVRFCEDSVNPIATQNPEEILAPLTLRRADFLTDCPLTDPVVKGLPDPLPSMPQVTTPRPST
ncbi:MAG: hypothetical protein AAB433_22525, partial [Nitrospirota bacterium]